MKRGGIILALMAVILMLISGAGCSWWEKEWTLKPAASAQPSPQAGATVARAEPSAEPASTAAPTKPSATPVSTAAPAKPSEQPQASAAVEERPGPAPVEEEPAPALPGKEQMPARVIRLHEVKAGENLHLIAGYYYGDARQWKKIWEFNEKTIKNPNRLQVGQIVKVEVEPGWKPKFNMEQYLAQERGAGAVKKTEEPPKKATYVREREEVHSTVTPRLLEEPGKEAPQETAPPPETEGGGKP